MKPQLAIGIRVYVRRHWLRSGSNGKLVEFNKKKGRWLVKFDQQFPGGGIGGDSLWLSEEQFETERT